MMEIKLFLVAARVSARRYVCVCVCVCILHRKFSAYTLYLQYAKFSNLCFKPDGIFYMDILKCTAEVCTLNFLCTYLCFVASS